MNTPNDTPDLPGLPKFVEEPPTVPIDPEPESSQEITPGASLPSLREALFGPGEELPPTGAELSPLGKLALSQVEKAQPAPEAAFSEQAPSESVPSTSAKSKKKNKTKKKNKSKKAIVTVNDEAQTSQAKASTSEDTKTDDVDSHILEHAVMEEVDCDKFNESGEAESLGPQQTANTTEVDSGDAENSLTHSSFVDELRDVEKVEDVPASQTYVGVEDSGEQDTQRPKAENLAPEHQVMVITTDSVDQKDQECDSTGPKDDTSTNPDQLSSKLDGTTDPIQIPRPAADEQCDLSNHNTSLAEDQAGYKIVKNKAEKKLERQSADNGKSRDQQRLPEGCPDKKLTGAQEMPSSSPMNSVRQRQTRGSRGSGSVRPQHPKNQNPRIGNSQLSSTVSAANNRETGKFLSSMSRLHGLS